MCAAGHAGATIIAIDHPELIGPACDRADLVVVSIPVYMSRCRSGATLVTARSLRTTGALAIRMAQNRLPTAAQDRGSGTRPRFAIDSALQGVVRPWTIQRYYDWRRRSYDLRD